MSGAPVNTGKVIAYLKNKSTEVSNEVLIGLAGGTDKQWSDYLPGPKAQSIVRAVNDIISDEDLELISEGIKTGLWRAVSLAEAHMVKAVGNLKKIGRNYRLAHDHVIAVISDIHSTPKLKQEAKAWRQLFEEDQPLEALDILRTWADEIITQIKPQLPPGVVH